MRFFCFLLHICKKNTTFAAYLYPRTTMTMLYSLLELIYPRVCAICGSYIGESGDTVFCPQCIRALPRTEQAIYRQNLTETAVLGEPDNLVRQANLTRLDKAASFLFFEKDHPIQWAVHKMKYADQPYIGYFLGRQAAIEMQYAGFFDGIDVIIPIPLHPARLRERGYNQSEYIARGISRIIGVEVDTTHVIRIRNTPKQALLTGENRSENVADAFAVNHPEHLYHKHILVVDDLITTGETMRSCLKAMKQCRAARFTVFALCKAR